MRFGEPLRPPASMVLWTMALVPCTWQPGPRFRWTSRSSSGAIGWKPVFAQLEAGRVPGKDHGPAHSRPIGSRLPSLSPRLISVPRPRKPRRSLGERVEEAENPFATQEEKANERKPRTWSDRAGKFKVEATLLAVESDHVVLRRTDGKEVTVQTDRLCDDDQKYLAALRGEAPVNDGEDGDDREAIPLTPTDLNAADEIELSASDKWEYKPDAEPDAGLAGKARAASTRRECPAEQAGSRDTAARRDESVRRVLRHPRADGLRLRR